MADIRNHNLTVAYLVAEQAIPSSARRIEVRVVDAVPRTADADFTFRLTDQEGQVAEDFVAAGQSYYLDIGAGTQWTYNIKAAVGVPVAQVKIT